MTQHSESVWAPLAKTISAIAAWVGTVQLAEVQTLVSILGSLIVAGYAATQWWVLWRDKVKRRNRE